MQLFILLVAHARQAGEAAGFNGLGELGDAGDLRRRPEQGDGLGAHARELQKFEQPGPVLGQQFIAQRQRAGGGDGLHVGGHALADAGDFEQAGGVRRGHGQGIEIKCGLLGGLGGAAIAADAEAVAAVDLKQVGGFRQQTGHGGVVHGGRVSKGREQGIGNRGRAAVVEARVEARYERADAAYAEVVRKSRNWTKSPLHRDCIVRSARRSAITQLFWSTLNCSHRAVVLRYCPVNPRSQAAVWAAASLKRMTASAWGPF